LYLPPEAVNSLSSDIRNFQHGGAAGMLNYSLFSTRNEYGGSDKTRYSQANLKRVLTHLTGRFAVITS
jgi:outer membrane usher protein FimD/PapC